MLIVLSIEGWARHAAMHISAVLFHAEVAKCKMIEAGSFACVCTHTNTHKKMRVNRVRSNTRLHSRTYMRLQALMQVSSFRFRW